MITAIQFILYCVSVCVYFSETFVSHVSLICIVFLLKSSL